MSYDLTDDLEKARQDQVIRLRHERDMARAERDRERERADGLAQGIREHHRPTRLPSGAEGSCRVCLYAYPCPTLRLLDSDSGAGRADQLERGIREIHRPKSSTVDVCFGCHLVMPCPTLALLDSDGDSEGGED